MGVDDSVERAEKKQQEQREHIAYKSGKSLHNEIQSNPETPRSPGKDGYGGMTKGEKEAYKKGYRGE